MEIENEETGTGKVITLVVNEAIVFETYRKVELRVPTLGFPPAPCECRQALPAARFRHQRAGFCRSSSLPGGSAH